MPALSAVRILSLRRRRREENTSDVKASRSAILCHGRSRQTRNVLNVADIWLKRAISLSVRMNTADMSWINKIIQTKFPVHETEY